MSEEINSYQPPQADVSASSSLTEAEVIRKAHINQEASVNSAGTLYFFGGILLAFGAIGHFIEAATGDFVEHPRKLTALLFGLTLWRSASPHFGSARDCVH